ncbi:hypothetical protein Bhyg_04190 [Pseudolycoriella hygida]|uniref:Uncharacterized protein n=1 Tax=Pseudolycoriella hygida TaxID=35572 RepID=A0A9Q0NEX9_9DIPT|nr:hypothetical protein Bhyg_04190 [Pseudolycoriella hygida]
MLRIILKLGSAMEVKVVGRPCGVHGHYTFFKGIIISPINRVATASVNAVTTTKSVTRKSANYLLRQENEAVTNERKKSLVMAIGDCIPIRPWADSQIPCLAELRKIWRDKGDAALLTEFRFYLLPDSTPKGRQNHGENFFSISFNTYTFYQFNYLFLINLIELFLLICRTFSFIE